jgi:hypothetical protein
LSPRAITVGSAIAACCALTVVAVSDPLPPIDLPQDQVAALSGMDVRIRKELIESAFGPAPLTGLIAVARDPEEDPGVRLRAYRALGLYKPDAAIALRLDLAGFLANTQTGTDLLYIRAVIEALALQQDPDDVEVLAPLLDFEASRDIRAVAADGLRVIQSTQAIQPLRARLSCTPPPDVICQETSEQVRLAISRALRALGEPE